MRSLVTEVPAAAADVALRHFEETLAFETDCWDVHESMKSPGLDFVLVDVRGPASFSKGHVQGAINIPHATMTDSRMAAFPPETLFVVYCSGPHCNGANKAAVRLARLGRPVKMMIGGVTGWVDDGFTLIAEGEQGHAVSGVSERVDRIDPERAPDGLDAGQQTRSQHHRG